MLSLLHAVCTNEIIPTGVNKPSVIWRRIITNFYFSSAVLCVHHQRASSQFAQEWLCVHLKFPTGYDAFRLLEASEFFLPASRCPWTHLGPQWLAWSVTTSVSKIKVWKNQLFKGMIRISCLHTANRTQKSLTLWVLGLQRGRNTEAMVRPLLSKFYISFLEFLTKILRL